MPFVVTATPQLGETLKGLRKQRGMTQVEVAKLAGLAQKTVSLLETAPQRCSIASLWKYLSALRVTMSLDLLETLQAASNAEAW